MRLGVDLGGTKIEIVALNDEGATLLRERVNTPQGDYPATLAAIAELVRSSEAQLGRPGSVGLAVPGTISTKTGLVKNANSTWLNGEPLDRDLATVLGRPVRVANDANCFALSEAADGAAPTCDTVFGVILGTGVGGGIVAQGRVLRGAHGIAGEWGHSPLPAPRPDELPGPDCYCGNRGCIETWCRGPAFERQYADRSGAHANAAEIAARACDDDMLASEILSAFMDRLARGLAAVVNILDPDAIVLGGGLSNIAALYAELPARIAAYAFTPEGPITVLKNVHGDSSGVRGAAWLWALDEVDQGLPR